MKKLMKIGGFLLAGFGFAVLGSGDDSGVVPGIFFMLMGTGIVLFFQFSGDISKTRARKELMELKSLLDKGALDENEYEEKSRALKDRI